jgi:hypothetical protein
MKKLLLSILVMSALMLSVIPGVFAVGVGSGVGVTITTEDFVPQVWQCDHRIVYDDATEPGRISNDDQELIERINNYAFEGEQIQWRVLVMDKNGIEKVGDVYVLVDHLKEANCQLDRSIQETIDPSCGAKILEENITEFNPAYMAYYTCTLTVEPSTQDEEETVGGMYGEADITVEVTDIDGEIGDMAEAEHWFLNPMIALDVQGNIAFENVRPGTSSYSDLITVGNAADLGSGVMMDMFISGTDFYDSQSSGAKCGTSNQLELSNFAYHATNGAYNSYQDLQIDVPATGNVRAKDAEGYVNIDYGIGFNDPTPFYDNMEILQAQHVGPYYTANVLAPGAEMSLTFRLNLPEPCNGDFDSGDIYFWGEAI